MATKKQVFQQIRQFRMKGSIGASRGLLRGMLCGDYLTDWERSKLEHVVEQLKILESCYDVQTDILKKKVI